MLNRLIVNFQNHKAFEIELDRINVFIGDNDTGKSAIVRAIKWLMLNKWDGKADQMIPWGEDIAEVYLHIDDHIIIRRKGPKDNGYILDGQTLRAGVGVPQEVANILNVWEDNFQDQDDPNFWLMLNSGQAAQELNEIFNLSAIDSANDFIRKELRDTRGMVKTLGTLIEESTATINNMAWVVEADKAFRELEAIAKEIQGTDHQIEQLNSALDAMAECEQKQNQAKQKLDFLQELAEIAQQHHDITKQINKYNHLIQHEETLWRLQQSLQEKESQLAEWLQQTCPLCGRPPQPLSGSRLATSTSPKKPPSPAPSKPTGSPSRKAT